MINLTLPWPPSVNHYWFRNKNGSMRVGEKGVLFRDAVNNLIFEEAGIRWRASFSSPDFKPLPIFISKKEAEESFITFKTERLKVVIEAYAPDKRRRDLDNLQKALLDSLTYAGVWADDDQVDDLRIYWARDAAGNKRIAGMIKVCIEVSA